MPLRWYWGTFMYAHFPFFEVDLVLSIGLAFGGWGFTSRMWGLTLDTIQSLDIVLANGTIATVSGSDDLFWVRGMLPIKGLHFLNEIIRP